MQVNRFRMSPIVSGLFSAFDPDTFMSGQSQGSMATRLEQCDPGEYTAVIEKLEAEQFEGKKDSTKTFTKLAVFWNIDSPDVKAKLGMDKVLVKQDLFIDLTPEGGLDCGKNKNVGLGKLREAVNQNGPGGWSPTMLVGQVAKVKVEHEINNGEAYARVKGVTRL